MTEPRCVVCGRPTADGYACMTDAMSLAESLAVAAGHAEDAEAVIARQTRYGAGGRGGSGDCAPDLTASVKLDAIQLAVDGWTSDLLGVEPFPAWKRSAGPACGTGVRCPHSSCAAIRVVTPPPMLSRELAWLSGQMAALRKHPAADEAFRELQDACDQLVRLVDRPADKVLVGMCDCGKVLYAPHGKAVITCPAPTCRRPWNVQESRDILRKALDDKLVTAEEAARLAQYLDTDRTQEQIRKLINKWASRGELAEHELRDEEGRNEDGYRFGGIALRLARAPRRTTREAAA